MLSDGLSPRIIHGKCGGWLAISSAADPLKIGVVATTEIEAGSAFERTREHWQAILETGKNGAGLNWIPPTRRGYATTFPQRGPLISAVLNELLRR